MASAPLRVTVRRGQDEHGLAVEDPAAAGGLQVYLAPDPFLPVHDLTTGYVSAPLNPVFGQHQAEQPGARAWQAGPGERAQPHARGQGARGGSLSIRTPRNA